MNFLSFALSMLPSPPPVFQPPEIPQGHAWCASKLCDTYRIYDVLPGHPASKVYGAIPPFAFCCTCGDQVDVDLPEEGDAA